MTRVSVERNTRALVSSDQDPLYWQQSRARQSSSVVPFLCTQLKRPSLASSREQAGPPRPSAGPAGAAGRGTGGGAVPAPGGAAGGPGPDAAHGACLGQVRAPAGGLPADPAAARGLCHPTRGTG